MDELNLAVMRCQCISPAAAATEIMTDEGDALDCNASLKSQSHRIHNRIVVNQHNLVEVAV